MTVFWIRLCLDSCSVICTVTLCYVLHQTHLQVWHIQNSVYSGIFMVYPSIFSIIKAYSHILRHFHSIFSTLCNPCIYSHLAIFRPLTLRTGGIFKCRWNFDQAYWERCHNQISLSKNYSAIFNHIQNLYPFV